MRISPKSLRGCSRRSSSTVSEELHDVGPPSRDQVQVGPGVLIFLDRLIPEVVVPQSLDGVTHESSEDTRL